MPLIIFALFSLLSYGLLIPWLGFYYDDWPFAWLSYRFGPMEFFEAFKPFRPFLSPYFMVTTAVLGEAPWVWHLFSIALRVGLSMGAVWSFKQIWPKNKTQVFWVAFLLLLFPGFGQQWVSLTHSNQEIIPLLFQIWSFGLMAKLIRDSRRNVGLYCLAFLSTFLGIFSTEYFITLELLRPIFIWLMLREQGISKKEFTKKVVLNWLPYALLLLANVFWLIVYQKSASYQSYEIAVFDQLKINPSGFILEMVGDFIKSFSLAAVEVWVSLFTLFKNSLQAITTYMVFGLMVVAFLVLWWMFGLRKSQKLLGGNKEDQNTREEWSKQAIFIGSLGVLLGRLPSWAIGLPLSTEFPYDRLLLSVMLGSCLFVVGIVEMMVSNERRKNIFLMILISLAVGWNFSIANSFRRDWDQQNDFFHQLTWRVPDLQDGTILLTHELPIKYVTDNSLSAALNWIYDEQNHSHQMKTMLVYSKARLGSALLPDLNPETEIYFNYRTLTFSSEVGKSLVLYYPVDGCLRVLDPLYTNKEFFPDAPYMLTDAVFVSNLDTIDVSAAAQGYPSFLQKESKDDWCYFFQKAELARQRGDWKAIVDLYGQSIELNLRTKNPSETMVFVEGYLHRDEIQQATRLIRENLVVDGQLVAGGCYSLNRWQAELPEYADLLKEFLLEFKCPEQT
jgi:hypothetical protein